MEVQIHAVKYLDASCQASFGLRYGSAVLRGPSMITWKCTIPIWILVVLTSLRLNVASDQVQRSTRPLDLSSIGTGHHALVAILFCYAKLYEGDIRECVHRLMTYPGIEF